MRRCSCHQKHRCCCRGPQGPQGSAGTNINVTSGYGNMMSYDTSSSQIQYSPNFIVSISGIYPSADNVSVELTDLNSTDKDIK